MDKPSISSQQIFYNFWGPCQRTLREDAVPSKFPFPSKKVVVKMMNWVKVSDEVAQVQSWIFFPFSTFSNILSVTTLNRL